MPNLLRLIQRLSGRPDSLHVTDRLLGDPSLRHLTLKFCKSTPDTLTDIRSLLVQGKTADLSSAAHKLAGSAGAYGFQQITAEARVLERMAAERVPTDDLLAQFGKLEKVCRDAQSVLEATNRT
jgi:HPt (histidine-containing phosphotransfer) domain-containing protein